MKSVVVILCLIASPLIADEVGPDLTGILKLTNGTNLAHACPTSMDRALTNRHVVRGGTKWIWGLGDGEEFHGLAEIEGTADEFRDMAIVKPTTVTRFPRWYPIAVAAPKIGDHVWFLGYDFKNEDRAFGPKPFKGTVTRLYNGHLVFKSAGQPGSSGSCILNDQGETVAINQGGRETENTGEVGLGVGVWGDWLRLKPDEPEVIEYQSYEYEGTIANR